MPKAAIISCCRQVEDCLPLVNSLDDNGIKEVSVYAEACHRSMADGYNAGLDIAIGTNPDVLVFTHSDVVLWSGPKLWNEMLEKAMEPTTGFVGVAGTAYLPKNAIWWDYWSDLRVNGNPLRGSVSHSHNDQVYTSYYGPYGEAVVMDGVFLACRPCVIESIGRWPTGYYNWHFYDIDITLRAHLAKLKNWVVPLPLYHGSIGTPGDAWEKARQTFCFAWKYDLPASYG
jgi:hypothetical protein